MFSDKITAAIVAAAKRNAIEAPALLALVEVETGGAAFESADGRTPQLLYERHIAFREAGNVSAACRSAFVAAGLAHQGWRRATQYKDQASSAQRLALIKRAKDINEEVALRSASWGLGQTMGFLAEGLGFANAREMVGTMVGSIDGQLDCMVRELKRSHLVGPLNDHDWVHVARIYNGAGYAANAYDTKLASAYQRWVRRLGTIATRDTPPEQSLSREEIERVQNRLAELGYHEVGDPDGRWGSRTTGAISAFQAHEGLPVNGHYDDATKATMDTALPREVSVERAAVEPSDLKAAGSTTIANAEHLSLSGRVMKWLGIGGLGTAGADKSGLLDTINSHLGDLRGPLDALGGVATWLGSHWYVAAIGAGVFIVWRADSIISARVADHQSGRHSGPEGG